MLSSIQFSSDEMNDSNAPFKHAHRDYNGEQNVKTLIYPQLNDIMATHSPKPPELTLMSRRVFFVYNKLFPNLDKQITV